jgi:hypothetical protein
MSGCRSWFLRWASLLVVLAILVPVTIWKPYHNGPPIRSDGEGYHIWTRAILEGDFAFRKYQTVSGVYLADPTRNVFQNKYPPGVALLRLPVMAFLVNRHPGSPLISSAEHKANLLLSALALLVICAACLRTCELLAVPIWSRHFALLALVFGTGLFHYATYDASFSHIYSALGTAVLMQLGVRALVSPHRLPVLATAATVFFLLLIRNTNVVLLGTMASAYFFARQRQGTLAARDAVHDLAVLLGGAVPAGLLQLGYNCFTHGTLVLSSYGDETFAWDQPMLRSVLFSYERGLFTYYPVVGVALAAVWAVRRTRPAAVWFTLLLLAYTTLYGFWSSWMLGSGFGHRGFVEVMPLAVVLFAAALEAMSPRWRGAFVAGAALCTWLTVHLMVRYWKGQLPMEGTTAAVYWGLILGRNSLVGSLFR